MSATLLPVSLALHRRVELCPRNRKPSCMARTFNALNMLRGKGHFVFTLPIMVKGVKDETHAHDHQFKDTTGRVRDCLSKMVAHGYIDFKKGGEYSVTPDGKSFLEKVEVYCLVDGIMGNSEADYRNRCDYFDLFSNPQRDISKPTLTDLGRRYIAENDYPLVVSLSPKSNSPSKAKGSMCLDMDVDATMVEPEYDQFMLKTPGKGLKRADGTSFIEQVPSPNYTMLEPDDTFNDSIELETPGVQTSTPVRSHRPAMPYPTPTTPSPSNALVSRTYEFPPSPTRGPLGNQGRFSQSEASKQLERCSTAEIGWVFATRIAKKDNEIRRLRSENEQLRNENVLLRNQLTAQATQIACMKERLESLQQELEKWRWQRIIDQLGFATKYRELVEDIAKNSRELETLTQEWDICVGKIDVLEPLVREQESELTMLRPRMEELNGLVDQWKNKAENLQRRIDLIRAI